MLLCEYAVTETRRKTASITAVYVFFCIGNSPFLRLVCGRLSVVRCRVLEVNNKRQKMWIFFSPFIQWFFSIPKLKDWSKINVFSTSIDDEEEAKDLENASKAL